METFFGASEYICVLVGYIFLMFLWPSVVFGKYLNGKPVLYRICFCVVTQVVIIDVVILGLGFFHVLNRGVVIGIFYGVFLIMLLYGMGKYCFSIVDEAVNKEIELFFCVRMRFKIWRWEFFGKMKRKFPEYAMLSAVLLFGIIYFSYGALQTSSYGCSELYTQHAMVYGLAEGNMSAEGIWPGAMQCFAYCMNALFHIPVYNILLYLQGIHVAVFLLSAYFLLREVFCWRFTPIFVLVLYLVWGVVGTDMIYAMSSLQWTIPVVFGLYTPFLCAAFLARYLKNGFQEKKRFDRDLLLFILSFVAAVSIHYCAAVMAIFICIPFAAAGLLRKKLSEKMGYTYIPILLASILFVFVYVLFRIGVPEFIPGYAVCASGYMMILSVLMMPVDAVFSRAAANRRDGILQAVSFVFMAGIYAAAVLTGNYHGYLFSEMTRYDSAAMVTNSIIENFPRKSYVVISPTDELYPVIEDGWHEELLNFMENTKKADYTLPQEYVFIYVEKKPLLYGQTYFFTGPAWLGGDKYWKKYSDKKPYLAVSREPDLITSEISDEEAGKDIPDTTDVWELYMRLENRAILEAKAYDWCQRFMKAYPYEMNVFYEDDNFVCYYLVQNVNAPYRLGIE